ncbi:hypothetical protein EDB19DRAFT_1830131 [Suillus lakei]|nr:hypothetical protein EDB19DRAFT_1830131 [Suillus lakei]
MIPDGWGSTKSGGMATRRRMLGKWRCVDSRSAVPKLGCDMGAPGWHPYPIRGALWLQIAMSDRSALASRFFFGDSRTGIGDAVLLRLRVFVATRAPKTRPKALITTMQVGSLVQGIRPSIICYWGSRTPAGTRGYPTLASSLTRTRVGGAIYGTHHPYHPSHIPSAGGTWKNWILSDKRDARGTGSSCGGMEWVNLLDGRNPQPSSNGSRN